MELGFNTQLWLGVVAQPQHPATTSIKVALFFPLIFSSPAPLQLVLIAVKFSFTVWKVKYIKRCAATGRLWHVAFPLPTAVIPVFTYSLVKEAELSGQGLVSCNNESAGYSRFSVDLTQKCSLKCSHSVWQSLVNHQLEKAYLRPTDQSKISHWMILVYSLIIIIILTFTREGLCRTDYLLQLSTGQTAGHWYILTWLLLQQKSTAR